MEVVASLSQGRTAAAQYGLFTHKSVPVIFEPPCACCVLRCVYCCGYLVCIVAILCVFAVLCVYCSFYFRCRTAG